MEEIIVKYGSGNLHEMSVPSGTTVQTVLNDPATRAKLGYGQNVEAHVQGVPQPSGTIVRSGMVLSVHDKACSKAK